MIFRSATAKSVKADFSKGEITLTFTVPFDEDERETASQLAKYVDADAGDVRLEIYPRQMSMYTTDHHPAEYTGFKEPDHAEDDSEMLIKAYAICKGAGYASVSELQRSLRVGYPRAARMIDAMHDSGLIADPDETGKRKWIGPSPNVRITHGSALMPDTDKEQDWIIQPVPAITADQIENDGTDTTPDAPFTLEHEEEPEEAPEEYNAEPDATVMEVSRGEDDLDPRD